MGEANQAKPHCREPRSACPVARSLDLIGDRWTLLVVRDMFFDKRRFNEFLDSPEGITTNILADRLKRLKTAGLVERKLYQEHPPRWEYRLTPKGAGLEAVMRTVADWAQTHLDEDLSLPHA